MKKVLLLLWGVASASTAWAQFETGVITTDQRAPFSWQTIPLRNTYTDPIVIVGPPSTFDGEALAGTRVRNSGPTSFEFRLDEWDDSDQNHGEETMGYLVIEKGEYSTGSIHFEAGEGTVSLNPSADPWQPITFKPGVSFSSPPAVFVQLASEFDPAAVALRIRNVTVSGFEIRMQSQESEDDIDGNGKPDRSHLNEIFHYFALPLGQGSSIGQPYQAGVISVPVDHNFTTFNFNTRSSPILFAAMQTANDEESATMRYKDLTQGNVAVSVQEEKSRDSEVVHAGESIAVLMIDSPVPTRRLLWYEPFSLADNTTDDSGATAWEIINSSDLGTDGDNFLEVRSNELVAKNTDSEIIWQSEEIPITGYTDVKVAIDVRSNEFTDTDDYLHLYYKLDGGPEIPLTNGLQRSGFAATTAMIGGLSGDRVQVVARVKNSEDDQYYFIDNVRVYTESDDRYAIRNGNWNDPSTWSYTSGGPTCSCLPNQLSNTRIDGYAVTLADEGYTHNLSVYNGSELNCSVDDINLRLYGNATLDVKSGGKISVTGASNVAFNQWNSRYVDQDQVRSGIGLGEVNAIINVDDPTGLQLHELAFDAAGTYTIRGNGNIELSDDLDINNEAEVTNNLAGELRITESLPLGYPTITFTNNGRIKIANQLRYEHSDSHFINNGTLETDGLLTSPDAVAADNSLLTNSSSGVFNVKGLTDLDDNELTIHNQGTIEMMGNVVSVEPNEGLFHNHPGAVWKFSGDYYDPDLHLFAGYESNEFHYNGSADQSIITPQDAYWHLTLSNKNASGATTSTKTPTTTTLDINGHLTMIGTAEGRIVFDVEIATTNVNLAGDWWQDEQSGTQTVEFVEGSIATDETVTFDGTSDQRIRTFEEYISVNVNKPSGQLLIGSGSRINGKIIFTKGTVIAQNNASLALGNVAQSLQASDISHVQGRVTKQGTTDFTFPLGDGTHYRPLQVSNLSESSHFTAEYLNAPAPNATAKPDDLLNLAPCGYWSLSRDPDQGNAQAHVTLFWDDTCPVDVDPLVIAYWNGSEWVALPGTTVGDASSGSITSDALISDFGTPAAPALFTLAESSTLPNAQDDEATTLEDTAVEVDVLANDTDDYGIDATSVIITQDTEHGTTTLNPITGRVTYTPEENFFGIDRLTYTVRNTRGLTSRPATLVITVVSVNDAPVAQDDQATTPFRTILNHPSVLTNDRDPVEGDALTATLLTQPTQGVLTFYPDGSYSYAPDVRFYGTDSFTYQACDAGAPTACDTATVTITVRSPEVVNQAPVAQEDIFNTNEDTSLTANVLTNDADPNGDFLMVTLTPIQEPQHGTVSFSDNGTLVYIPYPDFFGTDTFIYQVCDNAAQCDTATVTITVVPINDAPVALNDTITMTEAEFVSGNLLTNDYDIDQDQITTTLLAAPASGKVTLEADGRFTYTPSSAFTGQDEFTYRICDNQTPALCAEAKGTVVVSATGTLQIPKGFSPNGDATNDQWIIPGIRAYPDNTIKIFNRWGNIVYQAQGYDNINTVWQGQATRGMSLGSSQLPDGTYFYVLDLNNQGKPLNGYIILKR